MKMENENPLSVILRHKLRSSGTQVTLEILEKLVKCLECRNKPVITVKNHKNDRRTREKLAVELGEDR